VHLAVLGVQLYEIGNHIMHSRHKTCETICVTKINCRALLFDLDGVLIDSTHAIARVWNRWAVEHGFNPDEVVRQAHGRPSISTVHDYLPNADHELENRELERREMSDLEGIVPLPGSIALLSSIPSDLWTIVTSCTRALAQVRLRAAGLQIPRQLITSSDIVNGKPHPEPYLKAASLLGFQTEECIVVEDVPAGIRSGKSAGARVIALRTTAPNAELQNAGADWVVDNCSHISASLHGGKLVLSLNT
jgi:mannitol-1-/sugar-/sorbitol-6-phosphatase